MQTTLTLDHVLASAALPFVFPAVQVCEEWHGDGGIRLTAPLSPAIHLGAERILAISTRYPRTRAEAEKPSIVGYPPPAQVASILMNAIFLDLVDEDALRLTRINELLERCPEARDGSLRKVRLLVIRPSCDLGRLARAYEPRLPAAFRFVTRGTGTRETKSPDALSMVMFQSDYLKRLIETGETDAEARKDEIEAFLSG